MSVEDVIKPLASARPADKPSRIWLIHHAESELVKAAIYLEQERVAMRPTAQAEAELRRTTQEVIKLKDYS